MTAEAAAFRGKRRSSLLAIAEAKYASDQRRLAPLRDT